MKQFDFFLAETQINRFLAPCHNDFYPYLQQWRRNKQDQKRWQEMKMTP